MNNASAISRFVPPLAANSATRSSEDVNPVPVLVPVRSASASSAGGESVRAEGGKAFGGGEERVARGLLATGPAVSEARDQRRAGALEAEHAGVELGHDALEIGDHVGGVVALRALDQNPRPGQAETGPRAGQPRVPLLEPREDLSRGVEVADADAGLHPVRFDPRGERLDQTGLGHGLSEVAVLPGRSGRVTGD